jgi:hypothetical protein
MDLAFLATTTVSQILLPYLKEGAQKIVVAAKEKFGDSAAEYAGDLAGKVWTRVKSAFKSDADKATVAVFQEDPENAVEIMKKKLETKLAQDPQLANDLDKLVTTLAPGGMGTGAQIIGATYAGIVDIRCGTVSGGTVAGIVIGETPKAQTQGIDFHDRPHPKDK